MIELTVESARLREKQLENEIGKRRKKHTHTHTIIDGLIRSS